MPDDRPSSHNLLDLAPPDIAWFQERSDLILIPIGSCEQHGAHLPLGTDTITALEVSRRAAEKADVPYAPPFWAGYSPQHMREPETGVGTITLRADTFTELLYDIARSLIHHGWNKLVFVNGHGSNTKVIDPLLRRIKYETGAFVESLRTALRPDIPFEAVDAHVDDPDFAELVADRYLTLLEEPAHAG